VDILRSEKVHCFQWWNPVILAQLLQHITDMFDILHLYPKCHLGQLRSCFDALFGHTIIPFAKSMRKGYLYQKNEKRICFLLVFIELLSGTLCICVLRSWSIVSFVISFSNADLLPPVIGMHAPCVIGLQDHAISSTKR
jgi:hypothetical protein